MEYALGTIYVRPNKMARAGEKTGGHLHKFDHVTYVVRGRIHVSMWRRAFHKDGSAVLHNGEQVWLEVANKEYEAGTFFNVEAGVRHDITALEDHTEFHCIYSHRTPQGEVTLNYTGWEEAYDVEHPGKALEGGVMAEHFGSAA